jgi:hypothetical protein
LRLHARNRVAGIPQGASFLQKHDRITPIYVCQSSGHRLTIERPDAACRRISGFLFPDSCRIEEISMIPAPLAVVALVVTVATGPATELAAPTPMSAQQKSAAMQPLVRSATECIANSVARDPRSTSARANLGDLIVDSMPRCVAAVRAMIDAYDRYYGTGSGEAFFTGPYLDILPGAVSEWIAKPNN